MVVVQCCECTKFYCIVYFKMVNFRLCECHLNLKKKKYIPANKARSCITFSDLALESTWCHFHHTLAISQNSHKTLQASKGEDTVPHSQWENTPTVIGDFKKSTCSGTVGPKIGAPIVSEYEDGKLDQRA